jgi:hypothetical protein
MLWQRGWMLLDIMRRLLKMSRKRTWELTALLEQLEVISEAEKKLDAKTGNSWL